MEWHDVKRHAQQQFQEHLDQVNMTDTNHVLEQVKVSGHNADTLHAQRHMTHWGIVPKTPCTGVLNVTDAEWLIEDIYNGIDLAWEEHLLTCKGVCVNCTCNHYEDECYCAPRCKEYDPVEGEHDICAAGFGMGTMLIGFAETPSITNAWFDLAYGKRLYAPDPDAEYSAIVGETYAQVVRSKWVQGCKLCSPCYPGQGDLQQNGKGNYIAFTLPPDVWGDYCPEGVHTWGNTCPKCGQRLSAHDDDGSCV